MVNRFLFWLVLALLNWNHVTASNNHHYQAAMHQALALIKQNHAYLKESKLEWTCLEQTYLERASQANDAKSILLAFEHLMLEFADNHMILNTNNNHSYRLDAPVVVRADGDDYVVYDVRKSQIDKAKTIKVGAQFVALNQKIPQQIITEFPTNCLDKSNRKNQTWIINKALAGVYAETRKLTLLDNNYYTVDLDKLTAKTNQSLLDHEIREHIGVIRINDALGNTDLIEAFDQALNEMQDTNGLILDLRNTISGGDSYMARAIMGRLIDQPRAYQKHQFIEQRGDAEGVTRSWVEYVSPRAPHYNQPVVVLANPWTGSMAEGITIGLQGMGRATWIGTEMAGLLGAVDQFQLHGVWFSMQMPTEQLFQVDGAPREAAKPDILQAAEGKEFDDLLLAAITYLNSKNQ
ncbi:S41 family peptidase [Marinicella sp. S1101]|uniref:S41 family peptidase n=1 Tax=Marinicella marina TaxID=2996016 RepID=UPI002260C966|nr:S41 family peptidase [Marinicella marina]MCX7553342.1 S41 family peptidase [Marinicella marina]MDJ1139074.1 S41 family peptidase [Marinicella marina]